MRQSASVKRVALNMFPMPVSSQGLMNNIKCNPRLLLDVLQSVRGRIGVEECADSRVQLRTYRCQTNPLSLCYRLSPAIFVAPDT